MEGDGIRSASDVLVVEADPDEAGRMHRAIVAADGGLRVRVAAYLRGALRMLHEQAVGCVVTELALPDAAGADVVRELRTVRRGTPIIVIGGAGSEPLAVAALKLGAADYLRKEACYEERLPLLVREALGRSVLADVAEAVTESPVPRVSQSEPSLVAIGEGMRRVLALADRAAASAVPVLLRGETGTGKELLARAIHQAGPRRGAPFLVQNCAALADTLLESELFGHVRGAFTGAERARRGLFDEAGPGTVFLDEIGEAPLALQAKLLRVLQHGEAKAVGADRPRPVHARVVAATNRPLEADVETGRFRRDLYYRLAVFPIALPPLRHRVRDVPVLAAHFLARAERYEARVTGGLDPESLRALCAYSWPGNVRELENEMHRLVLSVGAGRRIGRHHLDRRIRECDPVLPDEPLRRILRRVEMALIRERLCLAPSKSAAARSLGITREALYAKMRRLGMQSGEP